MIVNLTKPGIRNLRVFLTVYDQHAPRLWKRILATDLSAAQAKTVMVRTFTKAWRHPDWPTLREDQVFAWLISLAHTEGLPVGTENTTC